ncbi:MAG: DUF6488 family protein [Porticoccaceae bacterium]
MKRLIYVLLVSSFFFGAPVIAGSGHSHDMDGGHNLAPITRQEAIDRATQTMNNLANAGTIDATWSGLKAVSADQKIYATEPEWVIIFKNDKVDDASRKTLYLFYTPDGHYIAANYTGN